MKHMHRMLVVPALAILVAPLWAAERAPDPCGDPAKAGQAFTSYSGIVLQAIDPVTLLVEVPKASPGHQPFPGCPAKGCQTKVRLVNLDPPTDPGVADTAQRILARGTRSQKVTLKLSPAQGTPGIINVLMYVGTRSINQQQVMAGLATYRRFGPAAVDRYSDCKMRRGQDQAKKARRGVWAR